MKVAHTPSERLRDGLRYYQRDDVAEALRILREESSATMIVNATGLGKTQEAVTIAYEWTDGRVLFLVHRKELIDQIVGRIEQMTGGRHSLGRSVGVEQGMLHSSAYHQFVVGSSMSVCKEKRLARLKDAGGFGLIIVDECHRAHGGTKPHGTIIKAFPEAKLLGLTATPDRLDGISLEEVFKTVAVRRGIREGVDMGYLAPPRAERVVIEAVNLDRVAMVGKEFAVGQLDEEMAKGAVGIARETVKRVGKRSTIIFCPGVQTAHLVATMIRKETGNELAAVSIDKDTPPGERDAHIRGFRDGTHQYLVNVLIAIEGFDAPNCEVIVNASPTHSRGRYTQGIGRGARILPGIIDGLDGPENAGARRDAIAASAKPHFLVLDMVGNCSRHSLIGPADIFAGRASDDDKKDFVVTMANDAAAEGEIDLLATLSAAEEQEAADARAAERMALDEERERVAEGIRRADVQSTSTEGDLFDNAPEDGPGGGVRIKRGDVYESEVRLPELLQYGFSEPDVRARGFEECLRIMRTRRALDVVTKKVMRWLVKDGMSPREASRVRRKAGARAMGYLAENGWSAEPGTLRKIVVDAGES